MQLDYRGLTEDRPGDAWRQVHDHGWPGWRDWFLAHGGADAPKLGEAERRLKRHMPEMEPLWYRLVGSVDGDDDLARFLTFWSPPRYLVNCSQLVVSDQDGPLLIRNYDLDPELNETTMLHSAWRGRRVMGMVEGLAGLADGMNDAGLAASLTFGGRRQVGPGFGIPLIMRYMLEICNDVDDAVEAMRAVPCHMSYNVTVADRGGAWKTVLLAPDRPAIVTDRRGATNHQLGIEMPRHAAASRTLERERHLKRMHGRSVDGTAAAKEFLRAPLFSTGYARGFGTVYTAAYRPASGEATLSWRTGPSRTWRIDAFEPAEFQVAYSARGSEVLPAGAAPKSKPGAEAGAGAAATPEALSDFFADLSRCLAGRGEWSELATSWRHKGAPRAPSTKPVVCGDAR